ncbi:hypothetical protein COCCADRAFT_91464 [Bipolaris zeicola 26-R-13]|uniref:Uncharacterized protein n=1 Tax=Cochliobolus carbonum (strain 26-R-13) TaxID=930089 RepID=W6Y6L9_COCC2|nr:uncharacterized protein COCCADRAFT_91464 [Bipolaris zeicola 26-R-13]EUC35192.1 hypothetical protein COCCADRAFT_91464 [Bipolaris zeicola 26-R-13]
MVTSLETRQGWFGDVNTCCTDTTISSPYGHAGQPFPPAQPERRPRPCAFVPFQPCSARIQLFTRRLQLGLA